MIRLVFIVFAFLFIAPIFSQIDTSSGPGASLGGVSPEFDFGGTTEPKIRILEPTTGSVKGAVASYPVRCLITGVSDPSNYKYYVNGKRYRGSFQAYGSRPNAWEFTVPEIDNYPLTDSSGSSAPDASIYPRFPFRNDLAYGWDKKVRPVLAEIISNTQDLRDLDLYVARDMTTFIDTRWGNSSMPMIWKDDTIIDNSIALQLTPDFITELSDEVEKNIPHSTLSDPNTVFNLVEASEPMVSGSYTDCINWTDLEESFQDQFRSELRRLKALAVAAPYASSGDRKFQFCVTSFSAKLSGLGRIAPSDVDVDIDPSVDPIKVSYEFDDVSHQISVKMEYKIKHRLNPVIFENITSGSRTECTIAGESDISFSNKRLRFIDSSEDLKVNGNSFSGSSDSRSIDSRSGLCDMDELNSTARTLNQNAADMVLNYYESILNNGQPRHHFARSLESALYSVEMGKNTTERGSRIRALVNHDFVRGDSTDCHDGQIGLYSIYPFKATTRSTTTFDHWVSWGDDLGSVGSIEEIKYPSNCSIVSRNDDDVVFGPSFDASVMLTTSPINMILWSRSKSGFSFDFLGSRDAIVESIADELELDDYESLKFKVELTIPPFLGFEWHFNIGQIEITAYRIEGGSETTLFKAIANVYNTNTTLPMIGDTNDNWDALSLNLVSEYYSVASNEFKPGATQLRNAFHLHIENKIGEELENSYKYLGAPEYANTPPDGGAPFRPVAGSYKTEINKVFIPLNYSRSTTP
ncbi:MAG: hypothetical protein HOE90_02520 [Bacteriovoracaceae bacterium]|nr:hypothetical protein [Bacteriovoracaceae bacterium]